MVLKAIGHPAGVSPLVNFEAVRNAILIKCFMELRRVRSQTVLITDVNRDGVILPETSNVLIKESQRRISRPSRKHIGLGRAVLRG
jgi:hypothetical protein